MKHHMNKLVVILVFVGTVSSSTINHGNGVCGEQRSFFETEIEDYPEIETCHSWEIRMGECLYGWRTVWKTRTRVVPRVYEDKFCCSGYKKISIHDPLVCQPVCEPPCIHSRCTGPGNCECFSGYTKTAVSYVCDPVCEPPCVNSTCIDHNECECQAGFIKSSHASHVCSPHCTGGCLHGECVNAETCSCHFGYYMPEPNSSICLPICSLTCEYGSCIAPDHCQCDDGYVESDIVWNLCKPYCSEECFNGWCMAPETCTCFEGYEPHGNTSNCIPRCVNECINGECVAPNECVCSDGFDMDSDGQCIPVCSNCENGICVSPETCQCNEGYYESFGACAPFCDTECINGNCTAPNECTCGNGTLKSSSYQCLLTCSEFPLASQCYYSSSFTVASPILDLNSINPTVQLLLNETLLVPCPDQEHVLIQDYSCYTRFRHEDESVISVCTQNLDVLPYNQTHNDTGWTLNATSTDMLVGFVQLSFVHRDPAIRCSLCSALPCPDSNRTLHLNGMSNLRLCLKHHTGVIPWWELIVVQAVLILLLLVLIVMGIYHYHCRMSSSYIVANNSSDSQGILGGDQAGDGDTCAEQIAFNDIDLTSAN